MKNPFHFSYPVASVMAHICCYNNQLPQGAPTSPLISNLICRKLDTQLTKIANEKQATYSRYYDDITFYFTRKISKIFHKIYALLRL